ncbi:MAG: hypothetical protein HY831_01000 [Candidatus Aenigmarchaeota archaeon]|nr:hypothetical protein [Candidatus Aenigmarchaeota archaeon]
MEHKCDQCTRTFASIEGLSSHKKDKHTDLVASSEVSKSNWHLYAVIAVIILIVIGLGVFFLTQPKSDSLDVIPCNNMEQNGFHIHAHLDIFVDGQLYTVPAGIGITNTCLYWLHTHDYSGIIHIEAPSKRTFMLGQFLDIWKKSSVDSTMPIGSPIAYVNGKDVSVDYRNIELNSHDEIALVYGKAPKVVPSSYDFPPGE